LKHHLGMSSDYMSLSLFTFQINLKYILMLKEEQVEED